MKIVTIIPARMGSSRFPGKPMKKINGIPMIEMVYRNVANSKFVNDTVVATCDQIIKKHINQIGGQAIMTSRKHERASDRCAEALKHLEKKNNVKYDVVIMVQGDEPMVNSKMLEQAIKPMIKNKAIQVVNLMGKIRSLKEFKDKNCIKVVCDVESNAIYFSRESIPSRSKMKHTKMQKQICVIPFRKKFLFKYAKMKPTPLEIIESIDMLRILENGGRVYMARTNYDVQSVDTPADLKKVIRIINNKKKN